MKPDQSEQVNELATALAIAQSTISEPKETGVGNYGKYSNLQDIRKAFIPPLNAQGIAVIQQVFSEEKGDFVETKLIHKSGQWIASRMQLKLDKNTMQGFGSAITYACRYTLGAIAGVGKDDDGKGADPGKPIDGSETAGNPLLKALAANKAAQPPLPPPLTGSSKPSYKPSNQPPEPPPITDDNIPPWPGGRRK